MHRAARLETKIPTKAQRATTATPSKAAIVVDGNGLFLSSLIDKEEQQQSSNRAALDIVLAQARNAQMTLSMLLTTKQQIAQKLPSIQNAPAPVVSTLEDDLKKHLDKLALMISTSVDVKNLRLFKRALEKFEDKLKETTQFIREAMIAIETKEAHTAIDTTTELLQGKISEAINLFIHYQDKKAALQFPATLFYKAAPARLESILFIESITERLQDELVAMKDHLETLIQAIVDAKDTPEFESTLAKLKQATAALLSHIQATPLIIEGTYLYVVDDISESYKNGWIVKDPARSELYNLLSTQLAGKNDVESSERIKALVHFLQSHPQRDKINYGIKNHADTLAAIAALLEKSTQCSHDTQEATHAP